MQIDLTGKAAVVTGSTAGIGFASAVGLARAGASVVLNGRKQEAVDKALTRLREAVPGADARGVARLDLRGSGEHGGLRGLAAVLGDYGRGAALRVDGGGRQHRLMPAVETKQAPARRPAPFRSR